MGAQTNMSEAVFNVILGLSACERLNLVRRALVTERTHDD